MTIEELVRQLTEPMFTHRITYALATDPTYNQDDPLVMRSKTRLANADAEIDRLVRKYVNDTER